MGGYMFHVFQGSLVAFGASALAFVMRRVPAVLLNVIKTKRQQTKTKCIRCWNRKKIKATRVYCTLFSRLKSGKRLFVFSYTGRNGCQKC